ncbi:MAG: hypothetical protein US96_C0013G0006 [Candidatus Woesebacteria bacterium GW2011_GWB1_38_5b]|uniref:Uncharacterized protein n=1 Tax=Candidatus Woesebacteria bacterium GW2011_GWB1_38_5b TaxID=1618569 RepID=A0A0G0K8Z2_9BACT|nr:MAG: hypothetical protein US96_C0013G0006 [Candidatus Woesebacteria bacterium GW2011_GWB1_38_5b]
MLLFAIMTEGTPIPQEELLFQTKESVRVAALSVDQGMKEANQTGLGWQKEKIIATGILASMLVRMISEGFLERFPQPPNPPEGE